MKETIVQNNYKDKLLGEESPFVVSEAYKLLRTNLFYSSKGEACPAFGVTSTFANSGKSLTISNLAISYAQLNKRVLLIDCDLRNSVIHKIFGVEKKGGISDLLAGGDSAIDHCLKDSGYPGLQVITAGGTPPNPAELLASDRMRKLLPFLKKYFDIIFVDMPPIGIVTDAAVMSDIITGYLFIVRAGLDDKRNLKESVALMEQMHANIVGTVINDVSTKGSGYYGKRGRYGKYGKYEKYGKYYYGAYGSYEKEQ